MDTCPYTSNILTCNRPCSTKHITLYNDLYSGQFVMGQPNSDFFVAGSGWMMPIYDNSNNKYMFVPKLHFLSAYS